MLCDRGEVHLRQAVRALALYSLLTVAITWPMITHLRVMDAGDSAFFAWAMGWELHALTSDPAALPHANIFYPLRDALGLDEPILGTTVLMLPFALFTHDAVWLLNVARLLTYVLSAFGAYRLAREIGMGERAALVSGAAFAFSLARCDQFGHVSTLGTQWLPFVLLFLCRFARTGAIGDAALAGLFYVLQSYACGYHGVLALAVLPVAALPLLWGRWHLLPRALPGLAVAAAGLLPLYTLHHAALAAQGYMRTAAETVLYSATIETFLAAPWWSLFYGELTSPLRGAGNALFVGVVPIALIAAGAVRLLRARRAPSRLALVFVFMALAAAIVALGPEIRGFGHTLAPGPYLWLREWVPIFQNIRVTTRSGAFLALAAAMLLGKALAPWEGRMAHMAVVGALVVAEGAMLPGAVLGGKPVVDTRRRAPAVYAWLAQQPEDFAVVELPIQDLTAAKPAFHESIYMLYSTLHWKRLLNGYAGIEPATYTRLRQGMQSFPAPDSIALLRGMGARYIVVHLEAYGPFKRSRLERDLAEARLYLVASFDGDSVYEIGNGSV
jgi:hypothetical protein